MIVDAIWEPRATKDAPSSILIIEDDPSHALILERSLQFAFPACTLQLTTSVDQAEVILHTQVPDLILCDLRLPGRSGIDLLRAWSGPPLPIIFVTSLRDEEQAVEAMRHGALDYILKSSDAFQNIGRVVRRAHREWLLRQENQRMQSALARSEERYRHLFEAAPIMYVITQKTPAGPIVTDCNTLFLDTLGYTREEVINKALPTFYDAQSQQQLLEDGGYERALAGQLPQATRTLVTRDGQRIETELRTQPEIGEDGQVLGTRAIYINVTAHKKAEQQLLFLQAAATSSADGITIVDALHPEVPFVYVNKGFEKLTGYTTEEAIGRSCAFLQNDDTDQPGLRVLYQAFQEGTDCHVVLRNYRKDGSLFMNDLHLSPISNDAGQVTHFVGIQRDVTEDYNATREIERLRNFYETILDKAPAQIAVLDREGRYTYINPAGIGDPELRRWMLGKTAADYATYRGLSSEVFETRTRWIRQVIETGEPSQHEEVMPTRYGRDHYVLRMGVPIKDESDRVTSAVSYGVDLTQIRLAETALRESQHFIEGMAQAMPQILYVCQPGTSTTVYLNRSFRPLLGYAPTDNPEKELIFLRTLVCEEDQEAYSAFIAQTFRLRDGEMCDVEYRIRHANGSLRWFKMSTSVLKRTPDGAVHQLVGIIDNITDRKRADKRIADQAELLDKAPDLILTYDLSGTITYINKSAFTLFDWEVDTVVGTPVTQWFAPEASIPFLEDRLLKPGRWESEYTYQKAGTGSRTLTLRLSLIHDDQNRPTSVLLIGTDITARKHYEERLLRTQRLESLGTLAGGIAHDLNNILNPILMGTGILKRQNLDESTQATLNIIESSTERGAALVKQVLTFARGIEGEKTPLQPRLILREVLRLIRETFPRTLTIQSKIAKTLPLVLADSTQLQQVIMNLCVNARDAIGEEGMIQIAAEPITITSNDQEAFPDLTPGPYVVIRVQDDGMGIQANIQAKIFEPFFTTKTLQQGTGLGLSIVAGIIKNHDGAILVESAPQQGSTFTVYLPALALPAQPSTHQQADQPASPSSATILLVEDEPSLRHIVKKALQQEGYTVLVAPNGRKALKQFRQHHDAIDLVLTDMTMPKGDGAATIEELRVFAPRLKIVATSGLPIPEATVQRLNIQAFLQKPYPVQTLKRTLQNVLAPPSTS